MSVENESVPLNNRKEWNNSSLAQFKSTKLLEGIEDTEELPPASKRKCTDCLMLLLFLAYWVGMVAISGLGYWNGNPSRLGKYQAIPLSRDSTANRDQSSVQQKSRTHRQSLRILLATLFVMNRNVIVCV